MADRLAFGGLAPPRRVRHAAFLFRLQGYFSTWPEIVHSFGDKVGHEPKPMRVPPSTQDSACATGGSNTGAVAVCPPVVGYDQAFRERAAAELASLPDGSAIEGMLADYAVLRAQSLRCDRL